jgi:hypothetical protein
VLQARSGCDSGTACPNLCPAAPCVLLQGRSGHPGAGRHSITEVAGHVQRAPHHLPQRHAAPASCQGRPARRCMQPAACAVALLPGQCMALWHHVGASAAGRVCMSHCLIVSGVHSGILCILVRCQVLGMCVCAGRVRARCERGRCAAGGAAQLLGWAERGRGQHAPRRWPVAIRLCADSCQLGRHRACTGDDHSDADAWLPHRCMAALLAYGMGPAGAG